MEADAWNPNSSPIQTWTATEILREINFTDNTHTIIKGILHYLESGKSFDGKCWYKIMKSNNEHPHAPWWHTEIDSTDYNDYNPTACLAGFIIRFAEKNSELYKRGCRIAKEAFDQLLAAERENGMHTLTCYLRLMKYIKEAKAIDIIDLAAVKAGLSGLIHCCITQETTEWETSYVCKPSQFLDCPDSMFYTDNQKAADFECDFIARTQLDATSMDGSGIDIWRGTECNQAADAIMCIIDLTKHDSEIKVLIGCTEEEKKIVYQTHNGSEHMKGIMIRRFDL